jgi:hypothetical protein
MSPRWEVAYFPEAEAELVVLPVREQAAMLVAVETLQVLGDRLPFPHSSAVEGTTATLRELRPRRGRRPWRAFYRRGGNTMVIAAIGPEAESNRRGFQRAVATALARLDDTGRLAEVVL